MNIYNKNGTLTLTVDVDDDSYRFRELMGKDEIVLKFALTERIALGIGSYCIYPEQSGGTKYSLITPESVKIVHNRNYEYTVTLESSQGSLRKYKLYNTIDGRLKFDYVAKPAEHLQLIVDNLNNRGGGWSLACNIESTERLISFNHTNIADALNAIAEAFCTEWEITPVNLGGMITLGKVEHNIGTNALQLSYGKGNGFLSGVTRTNYDDSLPIGRLYIEGGERNIDYSKYPTTDSQHSRTLLLPRNISFYFDGEHFEGESGYDRSKRVAMQTDSRGYYVQESSAVYDSEDSIDLTEIYPKREGKVTSILFWDSKAKVYKEIADITDWSVIEYDIVDTSIPNDLNFSNCLIEGETMTVCFQSGMLASREFSVKYYHAAEGDKPAKRFEIVKEEFDGITMPDYSSGYYPAVNSKYIVLGIMLPDAYLRYTETTGGTTTYGGAEYDALRVAAKHLYGNRKNKYTFKGELDKLYAKRNWANINSKIVIGGYVLFYEAYFGSGYVRIASVKDFINNPHSPIIELTNEEIYSGNSGLSSDLRDIESEPAHIDSKIKDSISFTRRTFRDAKETSSMLEKAFADAWGSSVNPITIQTMQMLVGSEALQIRFWQESALTTEISTPVTVNTTTQTLNAVTAYLQHLTLDVPDRDVITTAKPATSYHRWQMTAFSSAISELDPELAYYLYAKCNTVASVSTVGTGQYLLSSSPIQMGPTDGYYYFLVGILNSERDGTRSYVSVYGYTEILPNQITTGAIRNADGTSFFDLIGNAFKLGNCLEFNTQTSGENALLLRGTLVQSGNGTPTEIGAWCGEYSSTRTYKKGDEVYYSDNGLISTYRYINDTPSYGHAPTDTGYWTVTAKGVRGADGTNGTNGADGADGVDGTPIIFKGSNAGRWPNPQNGWAYYDTIDKKSYVYQNGQWYQMTIDGVNGANGRDGNDGLSIVWKGDLSEPPANPQLNWAYRDTDNGRVYIWDGDDWNLMTHDGSDGTNGTSIIFKGVNEGRWPNPQNGWAYYDTSDKKSYVYQSGQWYQMTVDGINGANGQDGNDGLSIVWKGDLPEPPTNPEKNWAYRDTDNGVCYIYDGDDWDIMTHDGSDGVNGTDGTDGLSVFITYHNNGADNTPAIPTGDGTTDGWHTNPTSDSVWISQKTAASASEGTWGTPIRIKGSDGDSVSTQYSVDGTQNWHDTFAATDKYMRVRIGTYNWSSAMKVVGEDGQDGEYTSFVFKMSELQPSAPTGTSPSPTGWADSPDVGAHEEIDPTGEGSWTRSGKKFTSNAIGHSAQTTEKITFTTKNANAIVRFMITASSEYPRDFGYICNLDSEFSTSSYLAKVSGTESQEVAITVPTAGTHYIYVGYVKDSSETSNDDNVVVESLNNTFWMSKATISDGVAGTWSTPVKITGSDGVDGVNGADGVDGMSVFITYHDNDVDTAPATPTGNGTTGGWHTNATAAANWISQKVSGSATSGTWGTPIRIGAKDGIGILVTEILYAVSNNGITAPTEGWSSSIPAVTVGYYLWTKVTFTYDDYTTKTFYSVSRQGADGQNGLDGKSPACPFRGTYNINPTTGISETMRYYGTSLRTDIVYYVNPSTGVGKYYIAKPNTPEGMNGFTGIVPTNTAYWSDFGASFDSVATGFLFAQEATIENAVVRKLRTSESGKRVVAESNALAMYDANGMKMKVSGDDLGAVPSTQTYSISADTLLSETLTDEEINDEARYHSRKTVQTITVASSTNTVSIPSVVLNCFLEASWGVMSGDAYANFSVWWEIDGEAVVSSVQSLCHIDMNTEQDPKQITLPSVSRTCSQGSHIISIGYDIDVWGQGYSDYQGRTEVNLFLPATGSVISVLYPIQMTEIGANGFRAMFTSDYIFSAIKTGAADSTIEFLMRAGTHGIKVNSSGLQILEGSTWRTATIVYNSTLGGYYLKLT